MTLLFLMSREEEEIDYGQKFLSKMKGMLNHAKNATYVFFLNIFQIEIIKLSSPIYVTQPTLPELADFIPYLEQIWDNKILTNGGPFHQQLEQALCDYLGVKHISLFTNGTLALVTALQALRITGEVITTPYSFVAT